MRKHINNRLYDTNTAKRIGGIGSGNNFTVLYKKRTSEYFIYRGENEKEPEIIPISYEAAKEWAADNLDDNIYNEEFIHGGDGEYPISIYINAKAKQLLDVEMSKTKRTQKAIIEELIIKHLK